MTCVLFGIGDRDEAREAGRLLGLSDTKVELLSGLGQDVALWRVKGRSLLVAHRFTEIERQFTYTEEARARRLRASSGPCGRGSRL